MVDKKIVSELAEKIQIAKTVCIEAYNGMSTEYMHANKETVALMIEMNDIKQVNLAILEELKKLNAKSVEEVKPTVKSTAKSKE